ncbi:MAG: tetratricopeptide repeat protein [Spirochaetota bacterium]
MKTTGQTPKALNDRGVIYANFGKLDLASLDFAAATARADYAPALVNLGNVALIRNDGKGAYEAYQRAVKLTPQNAKLLANLAKAAFSIGKTDEATANLEKVKALDPALAVQVAQTIQANSAGTRASEFDEGSEVYWIQE